MVGSKIKPDEWSLEIVEWEGMFQQGMGWEKSL